MSYKPHNLLVTGGAGFIGSNFVRHWLGKSKEGRLVVLDSLSYAGNLDNLTDAKANPRFVFVRGDICDSDAVLKLLKEHAVDTIVHFAAESHVDRSITGPDEFIRTNVVGTHALLKAAKAVWLGAGNPVPHRFHHISTDEVYGSLGPKDAPFREDNPYAPNSPYSASKAGSDHLVRAYRETFGLETTISNCSNNYGPYHFPEKLIPLTIVNILSGKPLPVYGDGLQVRDWLHVEDHCRAIELVLFKGKAGSVYNIGGSSEVPNINIVRMLCELVDAALAGDAALKKQYPESPASSGGSSAGLITHVTDRPGHDRRYAINWQKAGKELGYAPSYPLAEGLKKTVQWYLGNPGWWQRAAAARTRG
jgi:dTDP-glucose 4,6-dehydratase